MQLKTIITVLAASVVVSGYLAVTAPASPTSVAPTAPGSLELILYVEGLDGPSTDPMFRDWIPLEGYSLLIERPRSRARGGDPRPAPARFGPLTTRGELLEVLPDLARFAATGDQIRAVKLVLWDPQMQVLRQEIELENATVTLLGTGYREGDGSHLPYVEFLYERILWSTYDDAGAPTSHFEWDVPLEPKG